MISDKALTIGLGMLATAYPHAAGDELMERVRLKLYGDILAHLTDQQFLLSVRAWIGESKFYPTPAELDHALPRTPDKDGAVQLAHRMFDGIEGFVEKYPADEDEHAVNRLGELSGAVYVQALEEIGGLSAVRAAVMTENVNTTWRLRAEYAKHVSEIAKQRGALHRIEEVKTRKMLDGDR